MAEASAPAQSEAAKRAAARKAKILARGNTGLAKLAQTARGEEAQALYADDFKLSPSSTPPPPAPVDTASSFNTRQPSPTRTQDLPQTKPSWAPQQPSTSTPNVGRNNNSGMSAEQQAMSAQLEAMMSMFGGGGGLGGPGGPGGEGAGEMPDFSRLMAQMMGVSPDGMGTGGPGQNLLGDVDDPAGLGGVPPNLFGGLGAGGANSPFPFPSMPGMGIGPAPVKSKAAKWFPLVHFISIVLLSLFSVLWWEPTLRAKSPLSGIDQGWSGRWAGHLGDKWVRLSGIEAIPVFWAFTTLELILQTTRFMIFKSPPPPHSLIQTFLPILPPKISGPLVTGSRYLNLLLQFYKDGALFVFVVGISTVVAGWLHSR
ncbi:hypothetical protein I317_04575 [Kwoniella heveanensis CBS 569]|nr:hypothetical protein I317_04575 [Kwoniella heveanensis CBS 569]